MSGTSIVQRGKRFAVVAYAGIDPRTKKQRQKWFGGFKTRKEAEQFRLTLAHHPAFSSGVGPYGSPRLRIGDYLMAWIEERRVLGSLRDRTATNSVMMARNYVCPTLGHIPLTRLSPGAIQHSYAALLDRGLSPATVIRAAGVLHAALEDAVRRGLISRNPQDNTTLPKVPRRNPTVPIVDQVLAYLDDAARTATPAVHATYTTAVATGARPGELLALPETAVDLTGRTLRIGRTLARAGRNPAYNEPKTDAGWRTILLPEVAVDAIRAALVWKKEQRLRLGPEFRDAGLLFCGPYGRPLDLSHLRLRDHRPRLRRLGLPESLRLYDFRHFHVSELVAAGVDYRTVADRAGHRNPAFTIRAYAHARQRAQEHAAAVANDLLTKNGLVGR